MAVSAETLISIFSGLTDEMGGIISRLEDINARLAAVDLSSPDAVATLEALAAERLAIADFVNNDYSKRYRGAEKLAADEPATIRNAVRPTINITYTAIKNGNALNLSIKSGVASAIETAKANAQAKADATIERQAFLEANAEPQQPERTPEEIAFLEANQSVYVDGGQDPEVLKLERLAAARNANRQIVPPAATEDDPASETARLAARSAALENTTGSTLPNTRGIQGGKTSANKRAIKQDLRNFTQQHDWRVRLSLAPTADYLYKSPKEEDVGILWPLRATDGVIFPYTPQIGINYSSSYEAADIAHTNYKIFQYKNSAVDNINISCDFTAQDTTEAAYLLAVIHFLRTVTKMFYGQDKGPDAGIPPPLCYLHGLGQFQFNNHPLVITSFNYQLPTDVDYIRTDSQKYVKYGPGAGRGTDPRTQMEQDKNKGANTETEASRKATSNVPTGGVSDKVVWTKANYKVEPTYVPTKMNISFNAYPIVTRNNVSNYFSLRDYASGKLMQGNIIPGGTGMW